MEGEDIPADAATTADAWRDDIANKMWAVTYPKMAKERKEITEEFLVDVNKLIHWT